MYQCKSCSKSKLPTEFYKNNRSTCKTCYKIRNDRWTSANRDHVRQKAKERLAVYVTDPQFIEKGRLKARRFASKHRERNLAYALKRQKERQKFLNGIKDAPCINCGGSFPPCAMDFDHVRGEKVSSISVMKSYSMEVILEEIAKCDLVCSNCHRVRTFDRNNNKGLTEPGIGNLGTGLVQ